MFNQFGKRALDDDLICGTARQTDRRGSLRGPGREAGGLHSGDLGPVDTSGQGKGVFWGQR